MVGPGNSDSSKTALREMARKAHELEGMDERVRLLKELSDGNPDLSDRSDQSISGLKLVIMLVLSVSPPVAILVMEKAFGCRASFPWIVVACVFEIIALWVGLNFCQRWSKFGPWCTTLRWAPIFLLPLVLLIPEEHWKPSFIGGALTAEEIRFEVVLVMAVALTASWLAQFSLLYPSDEEVGDDDRYRARKLERASGWIANLSDSRRIRKVEILGDLSFTLCAAFVVNAFSILSGLKEPLVWTLTLTLLTFVAWLIWRIALKRWKKMVGAVSANLGGSLLAFMIIVFGFAWYGIQRGLVIYAGQRAESRESEPALNLHGDTKPIEVLPDDTLMFIFQLLGIGLATLLPFFAVFSYRRTLKSSITGSGFIFGEKGNDLLRIDQNRATIAAIPVGRGKRRLTFHAFVLHGGLEHVELTTVWKRTKGAEEVRYRYEYAILYEGATVYVFGKRNKVQKWLIAARCFVLGRGLVRPNDQSRFVIIPGEATEREEKNFQILDYQVPPMLHERDLTERLPELA